MSTKRYKAEQIVTLLRQMEVEIRNGKTTPQACKEAEITPPTYSRWRKEYGGLKLEQAKRLKELEKENSRLKRRVAELSLVKQVLDKIIGLATDVNKREARSLGRRAGLPGKKDPPGSRPITLQPHPNAQLLPPRPSAR